MVANKEYKESGVVWLGKLPAHWDVTNYRRLFCRRKEYDDNPDKQVLSLTIEGVKRKNENFGKMAEDFTGHQIVRKDDLVFTPRDFDVTPILSGIAPCDGCISNLYFVLYPRTPDVDVNFYNYFMWGVKWGGDIWKKLSYGMRFSYNYDQFCALPAIKIPLSEQKVIADYLDKECAWIDDIVEKQRNIIEKLKEYKKSVITEAVTKGLNPNVTMKNSGIEWIGKIPAHWEVVRMKSGIAKRDGGAWGTDANNSEGDCICLRIADFDYSKFRFADATDLTIRHYTRDVIEKLQLKKADILIEKSGGGEKTPVGRTVLFDKDYKAVYANFMDRLRCSDIVKPKYMQYIFVTFYENGYTRNYIKQTTGIQNLDLTSMLSKELMALPSQLEQQAIVDYLDQKCAEIDSVIEKREKMIDLLTEYKKSFIYECVTGKKEVA